MGINTVLPAVILFK